MAMLLLWALFLSLIAVFVELLLSGLPPFVTASIGAIVVLRLLNHKWHVYWIVPVLNATIWECFLRDLPIIYFGWEYAAGIGAVAAAVTDVWRSRTPRAVQGSGRNGEFAPFGIVVKSLPIVVLWVGLNAAPHRLSVANFDQSSENLSAGLPPWKQKRLDNSLKLLFARAKCYDKCTDPESCRIFGMYHNGKTAEQLIEEGDHAAEHFRLNYGCRQVLLDCELKSALIDNPALSLEENAGRVKLTFSLKNKRRETIGSVYGVVSIKGPQNDEPTTCAFCCSLSPELKPGRSRECVVEIPRTGWRQGERECGYPTEEPAECQVVVQSVITVSGVQDFRVLRKEYARCDVILGMIRRRCFDFGWRHLNADPNWLKQDGGQVNLELLRQEALPFFVDLPQAEVVRLGECGHLETGYVMHGTLSRNARIPREFRVQIKDNEVIKLVGSRYFENGNFELHIFPAATDKMPLPAKCDLRLVLGEDEEMVLQLPIDTRLPVHQ
jgi:hypothetical protein